MCIRLEIGLRLRLSCQMMGDFPMTARLPSVLQLMHLRQLILPPQLTQGKVSSLEWVAQQMTSSPAILSIPKRSQSTRSRYLAILRVSCAFSRVSGSEHKTWGAWTENPLSTLQLGWTRN